MSYTRQLLYSIADQMGRNRKDMDHYVQVLQKNWYDSRQSLQSLTINDYDRFDIPRRLSAMIIEKVGGGKQQPSHQQGGMDEEFSLNQAIGNLKRKLPSQNFNQCIDTLVRLFRNIRDNLTQEKFRILKKSNKKIADLISIQEPADILHYGGFENRNDTIQMRNVNIGRIDECLDMLLQHHEQSKFNPYQAAFMSTTGNQNQVEGESSVIFNDKLKELEMERERMMSTPIKDRRIRIYKQEKKAQTRPDANWNDERELNMDEKLYAESIKEKLKHFGEDPKFMNRRKQEYFDLMKKPCFSETLIRVKLPDKWIFECVFSPMETLGDLVKLFHELVQNKNLPYYLYMTPPVQRLNGMNLRATFYEKDCVPSGLFYFGSDEKIPGDKILKVKKSLFGF